MTLTIVLAAFGFLYSTFLGFYAGRIFNFEGRVPPYTKETRPGWSWRIFQFWFNFVCSAVGFAIAIYFLRRFLRDPAQFSFKVEDAIPLIVALFGITGLLPRTLFLGKIPPWKD
jgi:hypothetical protein